MSAVRERRQLRLGSGLIVALAFGAWSVYSSSVRDPTEVSSVTYDMLQRVYVGFLDEQQ
jgi:hypothetical protein